MPRGGYLQKYSKTAVQNRGRRAVRSHPVYKIAKDVQTLKKLINVEFKYYDKSQASTDTDDAGVIYDLNYVNNGDTEQTRDGSMFRMKSLEIRYLLAMNSSETTNPHAMRVVLFLDTDPNGSAPTLATLLDQTLRPHLSPRNLANRNRYVILKDKMHTINPNGNEVVYRKLFKTLDLKVHFDNATASASSIKKNGLYLLFLANVSTGATYKPVHQFDSRIRFVDN